MAKKLKNVDPKVTETEIAVETTVAEALPETETEFKADAETEVAAEAVAEAENIESQELSEIAIDADGLSLLNVTPVADEPAAEAAAQAAPQTQETKKKSGARDAVQQRRQLRAEAIRSVLDAATKPLSRADISRAADDLLGRPGDATSWADGGVAIAQLLKDGVIKGSAPEGKKKVLFALVKEEEVKNEADEASSAAPADSEAC